MSEALINNEISHEDFETIINEEKNYQEWNETIRVMESQRSDIEKDNLIEDDKRTGTDKIIRQNNLNPQA